MTDRPPPPPRPAPLPNPTDRAPGRHLQRGRVSAYLYETHGLLITQRSFMLTLLFLAAVFGIAAWDMAA